MCKQCRGVMIEGVSDIRACLVNSLLWFIFINWLVSCRKSADEQLTQFCCQIYEP